MSDIMKGISEMEEDERIMKIIPNWQNLPLFCSDCKTKKSVKYDVDGKAYCNKCVIKHVK